MQNLFYIHLSYEKCTSRRSEYLFIQKVYQTVNRVNGRVKYFDKIYIIVIILIIVFAIHLQDTLVLRKLSLILNRQIIKISVHVVMCTSFINIHKYANLYKRICNSNSFLLGSTPPLPLRSKNRFDS